MKKNLDKRFTLRLSEESMEKLRKMAEKDDRSVGQTLRRLVEKSVNGGK